jgi:23S rRNA (pseudouridine1915-N3)-methyltransferase
MLTWEFIAPSGRSDNIARQQETVKLLARCKPNDVLWLLDEVGTQISSPQLGKRLESAQNSAVAHIIIVIGGAYGVDDTLRKRADFVWSLSQLVFPHQIVRLLLAEQLYRAYEINRGSGYHHS